MKQETRITNRLNIVHTLQEMLSLADKAGDTDLKVILQKQIHRAKLGDLDSAKFILDRVFGTPVQSVQTKNETDLNININVNEIQKPKKK